MTLTLQLYLIPFFLLSLSLCPSYYYQAALLYQSGQRGARTGLRGEMRSERKYMDQRGWKTCLRDTVVRQPTAKA